MLYGTVLMFIVLGMFAFPIVLTFYRTLGKENNVNENVYFASWVGFLIAIGLVVYPRTLPERDRISLTDDLVGPLIEANQGMSEMEHMFGVAIGTLAIFGLGAAIFMKMAATTRVKELEKELETVKDDKDKMQSASGIALWDLVMKQQGKDGGGLSKSNALALTGTIPKQK